MSKNLFLTTAFLALGTAPALADLTASQVWEGWREMTEDSGQSLSAESESFEDGALTLTGVTLSLSMPDGEMSLSYGALTMRELGDGAVSIELPAEALIELTGIGPEGEPYSVAMTLSHTGLEIVASGDGDQRTYTYAAPDITLSADSLTVDGEDVPFDMDMTVTAIAGEYENSGADPMVVRSDMTAGGIALAIAASDLEGEEGDLTLTGSASSLVSTSSGTMSNFAAMSGLGQMIDEGLSSEGSFTYADARYDLSVTDGADDFTISSQSGAGELTVSVGTDGLAYGGSNSDVRLSVASSQMPLPDMSLAMESSAWQFATPIAVSEEPQDFALLLNLDGLTLSDMLWSMFDPGAALPRDPATLVIDLAGQANWLVDITDPELAETAFQEFPAEIHSLTLNRLRLDVAGAELTGTGDFTFDNSGGPAEPPVPVGSVDLRLVGANALLDSLSAMGVLPQEQAMGARMMLGLFARPGDGEDTLVSKIELTPEGGIVANGQPLR